MLYGVQFTQLNLGLVERDSTTRCGTFFHHSVTRLSSTQNVSTISSRRVFLGNVIGFAPSLPGGLSPVITSVLKNFVKRTRSQGRPLTRRSSAAVFKRRRIIF